LKEQYALDQHVRMFHLVYGFLVFLLVKLRQAPVLVHPRMQKVLVNGCQLVCE
jgi:hypothetical protein